MNKEAVDFFGTPIKIGDVVAHASRSGSSLHVDTKVVTKVDHHGRVWTRWPTVEEDSNGEMARQMKSWQSIIDWYKKKNEEIPYAHPKPKNREVRMEYNDRLFIKPKQ